MKYIEVAVLTHTKENFNIFTYSIPKESEVNIGRVVEVPFRNRKLHAVVIGFTKKPEFKTKEILKILDATLPEHLISLAKWISEYYAASINSVFRTMLPTGFYKKRRNTSEEKISQIQKSSAPKLTPDQEAVLNKVNSKKPNLLFGVTGSGKTEIYRMCRMSQRKEEIG